MGGNAIWVLEVMEIGQSKYVASTTLVTLLLCIIHIHEQFCELFLKIVIVFLLSVFNSAQKQYIVQKIIPG